MRLLLSFVGVMLPELLKANPFDLEAPLRLEIAIDAMPSLFLGGVSKPFLGDMITIGYRGMLVVCLGNLVGILGSKRQVDYELDFCLWRLQVRINGNSH